MKNAMKKQIKNAMKNKKELNIKNLLHHSNSPLNSEIALSTFTIRTPNALLGRPLGTNFHRQSSLCIFYTI